LTGELSGMTVIVTGSSSGIGAATAVVMARHGAAVVINHRSSPEKADRVAGVIRADGGQALILQADVTDREQVQRMVDQTLAELRRIDVLVTNVGHAYYRTIENLEPEDWQRTVDENLTSQMVCIQAALPVMLQQGWGRIIAVSSISAQRGSPSGDLAYSACKAGVHGLVKTLARLYAHQGILVNTVAPGIINSGMTKQMSSERRDQAAAEIPLRRFGNPEEVGELIAFLASERASYITGQLISVNGGLYV